MRSVLLTTISFTVFSLVQPESAELIKEYDEDLNKFYFTGGCALVYGFVYENGTSRPLDAYDRELLANYTAQYYVYRDYSSSSNFSDIEPPIPQVPCLCDSATCANTTWCKNETVAYISGGCALQDDYVYDNGTMRGVTALDHVKINNYTKAFDEYMSTKFNDTYTGPELESPKIPCFCESSICAEDIK